MPPEVEVPSDVVPTAQWVKSHRFPSSGKKTRRNRRSKKRRTLPCEREGGGSHGDPTGLLQSRPHPRYLAGDQRKAETLWQKCQRVWAALKQPLGYETLSVPAWYSGTFGVPHWYLRQPMRKLDCEKRQLTLLVRMNYILDRTTGAKHRRLRYRYTGTYGPLWEPAGREYNSTGRVNTSFALSVNYDISRALACTLRNFVPLAPLNGPRIPPEYVSGAKRRYAP